MGFEAHAPRTGRRRLLALLGGLGVAGLAARALRAQGIPPVMDAPSGAGLKTIGGLLVDIRTPREQRESGVPKGAVEIPLQDDQLTFRASFPEDVLAAAGGDRSRPVALICANGQRSLYAARLLAARLHPGVRDRRGAVRQQFRPRLGGAGAAGRALRELLMRRLLCHPRVRAFFLVLWGIGWCVVLYMSLRPLQEMPLGLSDKTLHLTGYALMTLLTVGFCHIPARLLRLALGTVAASAGIEMIQGLLPYRTFELLDLAANATGATLGMIAALVLLGLLRPGEIRRPAPS